MLDACEALGVRLAFHLEPYEGRSEVPLHPTPYTLRPTPHILHPTPYTLRHTPYTLHPTPFTLHPIPYTLHPTLYIQHPTELGLDFHLDPYEGRSEVRTGVPHSLEHASS